MECGGCCRTFHGSQCIFMAHTIKGCIYMSNDWKAVTTFDWHLFQTLVPIIISIHSASAHTKTIELNFYNWRRICVRFWRWKFWAFGEDERNWANRKRTTQSSFDLMSSKFEVEKRPNKKRNDFWKTRWWHRVGVRFDFVRFVFETNRTRTKNFFN